jgi:hypothetical protein
MSLKGNQNQRQDSTRKKASRCRKALFVQGNSAKKLLMSGKKSSQEELAWNKPV